jgi:hypothetical protein
MSLSINLAKRQPDARFFRNWRMTAPRSFPASADFRWLSTKQDTAESVKKAENCKNPYGGLS